MKRYFNCRPPSPIKIILIKPKQDRQHAEPNGADFASRQPNERMLYKHIDMP